jgi:DNA-binding transcriptional regulator YhcF (GntR family)
MVTNYLALMNTSETILHSIKIDNFSATPKYLQLSNSILNGIEHGLIKTGQLFPSINELSFELDVSRDTAEKSYRHLKKIGVLDSVPGKGYFIKDQPRTSVLKICLLFNKLSTHKKMIYDAFSEGLGVNAAIDFYIYNNDFSLFKSLLESKKDNYSHYVIIPHFTEGGGNAHDIINAIPKDKLVLLDKKPDNIEGEYAAVYENFSKDIFGALQKAQECLKKYKVLKLVFPVYNYYPMEIIEGFKEFCSHYKFEYKIIDDIVNEPIVEGDVYISLVEDDLVALIERLIFLKLKAGKDVGIISYNEVPIKKIILEGITTVSTDFAAMGSLAAKLILSKSKEHIEVPFNLILRNSL